MVQRRKRRTTRRTTKKSRVRRKKGVARKAVKAMQITPAQRKKLQQKMRDFEKHINLLTRKYNQILNTLARF
jgi:hypothetical protein